ncbi:MAG TPA: hypothetical protein P5136_00290 [Methanofastidiosum sp.]|nr:hypothetical protein [Methanofastidiosum sp.]
MTKIDLSYIRNEEDANLFLDLLVEELFLENVKQGVSKIDSMTEDDVEKVAEYIALELLRFAAEKPSGEVPVTVSESSADFSFGGYSLDTWMDYWFGLGKSSTLGSNKVFFESGNRYIELLRERIAKLSPLMGLNASSTGLSESLLPYETKKKDVGPREVSFKGITLNPTEKATKVNAFIKDLLEVKKPNVTPEKFALFIEKYKDTFIKSPKDERVIADRVGLKKMIIDFLNNSIRKLDDEIYTLAVQISPGLRKEAVSALTGEPGTAASADVSAGLHKEIQERQKDYVQIAAGFEAKEKEQQVVTEKYNAQKAQLDQLTQQRETAATSGNQASLQSLDSAIQKLQNQLSSTGYALRNLDYHLYVDDPGRGHISYKTYIRQKERALQNLLVEVDKKTALQKNRIELLMALQTTDPSLTLDDYNLIKERDRYIFETFIDSPQEKLFGEESLGEEGNKRIQDFIKDVNEGDIVQRPEYFFKKYYNDIIKQSTDAAAYAKSRSIGGTASISRIVEYYNYLIARYKLINDELQSLVTAYAGRIEDFNKTKLPQLKMKLNDTLQKARRTPGGEKGAPLTKEEKAKQEEERKLQDVTQIQSQFELLRNISDKFLKDRFLYKLDSAFSKEEFPGNRNTYAALILDIERLGSKLANVSNKLQISSDPDKMLSNLKNQISDQDFDSLVQFKEKLLDSEEILKRLPAKEKTQELVVKAYTGYFSYLIKIIGKIISRLQRPPQEIRESNELGSEILREAIAPKGNAKDVNIDADRIKLILNAFSEIDSFKELQPTVKEYLAIIDDYILNMDVLVRDVEKRIVLLKDIMNHAINFETDYSEKKKLFDRDVPLDKTIEENKKNLDEILKQLYTVPEGKNVEELKDKGISEANKVFIEKFQSEFRPQTRMAPATVGEQHRLQPEPEFEKGPSPIVEGGKTGMYAVQVPRKNMVDTQWNFYNIIVDWKDLTQKCIKSLESCRKGGKSNIPRTFAPPENYGYIPDISNVSRKPEGSVTDRKRNELFAAQQESQNALSQLSRQRFELSKSKDPGAPEKIKQINSQIKNLENLITSTGKALRESTYEEEIRNLKIVQSRNIGDSLALIFSDKGREEQKLLIDTNYKRDLETLKNNVDFIKKEATAQKDSKSLDFINKVEMFLSKIPNDIDKVPAQWKEKLFPVISKFYDIAEKIAKNRPDDFNKAVAFTYQHAFDMLFSGYDDIKKVEGLNVDKIILFKLLYAPHLLTSEEVKFLAQVKNYISMFYKNRYKHEFGK